ncbi:hypothetical protein [Microbacterium sp. NPDC056234]|uniref:hypothetical protein n=1 Tax=Microbacterium sp. NPDC056234 TaxID=3345757 RepID=UPI0035E314D5
MAADIIFEEELRRAVDAEVNRALASGLDADLTHRQLMDRAKLLVVAALWSRSSRAGDLKLIETATESVLALRRRQGPRGLFIGGGNVDSPPDSAFTVNDLCDTLHLLRSTRSAMSIAGASALAGELDAIADAVEPALLVGGVHTPNHRWEITAALARLHRRRPSPALAARASEWLAEGVDLTADGVYSERSANYAAYVSNPSLTVIADVFDSAEARAAVVRNLESTLGLIHPDGTVETVHSRRQDQLSRFALSPYLMMYRRFAVLLDRGDFAWAAERAREQGIVHPASVLADLLLEPRSGEQLPEAIEPEAAADWAQSALAIDATPRRRLVVFGGSDYPRFRRVRSGLSTNPTFLRLFAGAAVLDSMRLSRDFFGLGPFRADRAAADHVDGVRHYRLSETASANYYQPMDPVRRNASGEYALTDDGRFFGSMSFADRAADAVALRTDVDVVATDDGASVAIAFDGPECTWALELSFRGGAFEGVDLQSDGTALLTAGAGSYRCGDSRIVFEADADYRADGVGRYRPGEDYTFLGATDAATGDRVYLTGRSPGRVTLTLRAESARS